MVVPSRPLTAAAYKDIGDQFFATGKFDKAGAAYLECLKSAPATVGAALGLARVFREIGKIDLAVKVLETSIGFNPDNPAVLSTLGAALGEASKAGNDVIEPDYIIDTLRRATELAPGSFDAAYNLGNSLAAWGDWAGAAEWFSRALTLRPDDADCIANILSTLLYDPAISGAELRERTVSLLQRFGIQRDVLPSSPRRTGRIRLGWLSSDLHGRHPVFQNTLPLLRHLDRYTFEHIIYSDAPRSLNAHGSAGTLASIWRDTQGVDDKDLAETIRQDKVDILMILAGRFDRNRVLFGLHRAARVQISFHDPATSGLPNMDYIALDRFIVPRQHRPCFTERVVRFPSFYTHDPMADAPDVGPLPMAETGVVTFGCFNKPVKINSAVLDLWARVLKAIPYSRLVLKFQRYRWASLRKKIISRIASQGVDASRVVILYDKQDRRAHLAAYNTIDVALDPFPFSGSTTTFEGLWMGVPVVTRPGDTAASRWTGSMLHALKLDNLIANGDDDYITILKSLAADPERLAMLRATLRERVARSPLCDGGLRGRQFARIFRAVYQGQFSGHGPRGSLPAMKRTE